MKAQAKSLEDLNKVAVQLLVNYPESRIFAFVGKMGAGKTTFIQQICSELGVTDQMSSPTFSIVNEYLGNRNSEIYHFDMYRLEKEEEAFDMGFDEYLASGNYCFIEWPDKVSSLLPKDLVIVRINVENDTRIIFADII